MTTTKYRISVRKRTWVSLALAAIVLLPAATAMINPAVLFAVHQIDSLRISAIAQQHPNYSVEQRIAVMREVETESHPRWKDLTWSARLQRSAMFVARLLQPNAASSPATAAFVGNQTVVTNTTGGLAGFQRQANCSLSLYSATYTLGVPSVQFSAPVANYELVLHNASGVNTRADLFAKGCNDPTLGIGSRRGAYLGKTTQGLGFAAGSGYDSPMSANALFSAAVNPNLTSAQSTYAADLSLPGIMAIAVGDLNGDGLADVVGLDATSGTIRVWLANANGTLRAPTSYAMTGAVAGSVTETAVLADVNGDGKVDVVVATCSQTLCSSTSGQEQIWILTGKGDGTLNAAQPLSVPTPSTFSLHNLIAADLRGTGHLDLVGSNGLVLLNSGTGTFTTAPAAFAPGAAASDFGPNLAAADFNNDGKPDLAVSNGATIQIYIGKGDGSFSIGKTYASINDVGYLTATDLDGDGNVDLYVGIANGGAFGGDQFAVNQVYALMGNGDGSFQGAPSEPFTYNGSNVVDLNADKILDFVGVSAAGFTSYLGDGKGAFTGKATLALSPVTIGGQVTTVSGSVDSFALADINGDGIVDLAYIVSGFTVQNAATLVQTPGVFIALGNGQGGFAAPVFYAIPSTLSASDFDDGWVISYLHLADFNRDGKTDLIYSYVTASHSTGNNNFGTVVQLGNGDGTFRAPQVIPFYSAATSGFPIFGRTSNVRTIVDLNKDGIPDLVFVAQLPSIDQTLSTHVTMIQVALGKGDGTFSTPASVTGPTILVDSYGVVIPASVAVGDMNGDGIPDIVALGSNSAYNAQLAVALGNGDGTFKAPILTNYAAQYLNTDQGIALGDFNGDGKLDVAISDPYTASNSGISLGNGDGTVQTIAQTGGLIAGAIPVQSIALSIAGVGIAADFNGDGKADLMFGATLLLSQAALSGGGSTLTTTTLTAAPNPVTEGQSLNLSATVTSASQAKPTGSVGFFDGTTALGTAALSAQGTAALSLASLALGTHPLTAKYSGDSTFAVSTSSTLSLTVSAAKPDFAVAVSPASASIAAGAGATATLTLTPSGGFTGTVMLACSGLPAGGSCSFAPASIGLTGASGSSSLTLSTTATTAQNRAPPAEGFRVLSDALLLAVMVPPLIVRGRSRRQRRRARLSAIAMILAAAGLLHGCHGGGSGNSAMGSGTPAGSYTVTVTATSGSTSHTASFGLTVT